MDSKMICKGYRAVISGQLWNLSPSQESSFKETGVGGLTVGTHGNLLELKVSSGEKIIGGEFSSENKAAVWTERGNIYILSLSANHYRKLGKPGIINCLQFVTAEPVNIVVGLKTKKALVINTETGAVRKRFSETEDIQWVGSCSDTLAVLTIHHLSVFSYGTAQLLSRLVFKSNVRAEFVHLLGSAEGRLRAITASMEGKVAVWDLQVRQPKRAEAELVTSNDLKTRCSHFAVTGDSLFYVVRGSVFQLSLTSSERSRVYCGEEEVGWMVVRTVRDRLWLLLSLPTRTVAVCDGRILAQFSTVGRLCLTADGFLMLVTRPDGATEVLRTAEVWWRTAPVQVTSLHQQRSEDRGQPSSARNTGRGRTEAEAVREEKTVSQMSSLLSSGLLSYPSLQRPVIWASILGLPRDRRVHAKHCREVTEPEDVISRLTSWSPDLQLVPHLSSLLSPFLRLYSGHPTTALELSLVLLTSYSWLSSYPGPAPPLVIAWSLLGRERPELRSHLTSLGASQRSVFWPAFQSAWHSVLSQSDWLQLWDHLVTTGPQLLVPALLALPLSLSSSLMASTSLQRITSLLSSKVSLDMKSFLSLAYHLLEKYEEEIRPILTPVPDLRAGYPPPILLEQENREVLRELNPDQDHIVFIPAKSSRKEVLAVSPPPVPRLRTHSRQAIIEGRTEADKENSETVGAPLVPGYPPTKDQTELLGDMEDITSLLNKAKVLRQVIHSKK